MRFGLVGLYVFVMAAASQAITLVTRQDPVDHFLIPGRCKEEACLMESSGTAVLGGTCTCRCLPHVPVFREDLQLCVDDIHECSLAPFYTNGAIQKIPYVFLPLKGQIINPSSEIVLSNVVSPICVVSNAKYLSSTGWTELKNKSALEPPFRLYRDEGRNYLQWLGSTELRLQMEGRLLLISMMCKDGADQNNPILNPCVAFRVSGTPSDLHRWSSVGVKEVLFATEAPGSTTNNGIGSEYVAIAMCFVAIGLAYAIGVVWYLKKRNKSKQNSSQDSHPGVVEEGVVKNNPLLRHCQDSQQSYPSIHTSSSDSDDCSDIFHVNQEINHTSSQGNVQITSAMVHPRCNGRQECDSWNEPIEDPEAIYSSSIERHPEENISIVETPEHREDRLGIIASQTGRRKLYFNPAYFEHELLLAPPPAAVEFLTKIREVMTIAKSKMEAKRFLPSLLGIAEEREDEVAQTVGATECASCRMNRAQKDNSTKGSRCDEERASCCHNCNNENKVNSIRKWLEDVPFVKNNYACGSGQPVTDAQDYSIHSLASSKACYSSRTNNLKEESQKTDNVNLNNEKPVTPDNNSVKNDYCASTMQKYSDHTAVNDDSTCEIDKNIYMEQRYEKFSPKSCRDDYMDYECITENTCKELGIGITKSGFSSPTEYADIRPNIVEKVNCSIVFNRNGNNEYQSGGSEPPIVGLESRIDHDYEMIMINSADETKSLPDLANDDHSFVSEVYVNDGYGDNGYPRSESSMNSINSSTNSLLSNDVQPHDQRLLTIKVEGETVQRDECESDDFEPDTLDRKPAKLTIHGAPPNPADITIDFFADSLERQPQIALKSNGSFKSNGSCVPPSHLHLSQKTRGVMMNKAFGSLREIFVAKNRYNQCHHRQPFSGILGTNKSMNQVSNFRWGKERYKTLKPESRQAKRQRAPSPQNHSLPPIPSHTPVNHEYKNILHEHESPPPLPARKTKKTAGSSSANELVGPSKREKRLNASVRNGNVKHSLSVLNKLPEMTSNNLCRVSRGRQMISGADSNSTTEYEFLTADNRDRRPQFYLRKTCTPDVNLERNSHKKMYRQGHRTEDSGYLSTDSNNSGGRREDSETDADSFFDGASESGAESIATDSFSFGKNHSHTLTFSEYTPHNESPQQI